MKISAVVLTKNEEKNITECLKTLSWCDEKLVIDDNSSDKTVELAKKEKTIVYKRKLNDDFSAQRNYGVEKAKFDWVLFVDADERISSALQQEIKRLIEKNDCNGFFLKRDDRIWYKKIRYGENANSAFLRLGKKNCGRWEGTVHETWDIKGEVKRLKNPLLHFPHPTIVEFIREIDFYTTLRARELFKTRVKVNPWDLITYPKAKFVVNYFLKLGFLDGIVGMILALCMSFHSYLVRAKLWTLWNNEK